MLIFGAIWWLFGSKSKSAKALARAPKHQLLLSQFENIRYIRAPKVLSRKKKLLKNIFRKLRMSTPPSYGRVAEPNRMNFRKNFKRPSTPPHFWKIIIQFFSENVRKKLLIKVQNLQYENDTPPPLELFLKFALVLFLVLWTVGASSSKLLWSRSLSGIVCPFFCFKIVHSLGQNM